MMIRAAGFALWLALAGLALTCIAMLDHQHERPNAGLPLVRSDYEVCAKITPPPLAKAKGIMPTRNSELS